jgi:creatinine amidohydrolase
VPAAVARTATRALSPLALGPRPIRRVVASGVGSSAAHAALLVHTLRTAGRDALSIPISSFLSPASPAPDDVLVVFSQGLSPNARLALATPGVWRRVVLVTAVTAPARLAPLRTAGIVVQTIDGEDEFGTLVRVVGPMTGYVAALRLAAALGGPPAPTAEALADACAPNRSTHIDLGAAPLAFVTSGTYADLVTNLQFKVLEGLYRPLPPVWDILHLAHGPFQERATQTATFLALTRPDAPGEAQALDRFAAMLDPTRHTLLRLPARHGLPLALFEHETMLNTALMETIAAAAVDQVRWPGRDADGPLYDLATRPAERRLARMVWPEVAARRPRLAIVPLGALEQHGPHLPFATDTFVADALGARVAARYDDAVVLPALRVGCSSEHAGFPGTIDLRPDTLIATLIDTLRSLAAQGVEDVFVFSAHGGNVATLHDQLARLAAAVPGGRVRAATDLDALTACLHETARTFGVTPEAAGHHAGEVETSIMLALHPELVRLDALTPGYVTPTADPQTLFCPDLRRHAPNGTVGDPRGATALRGERYLAAWTDVLVAALGPLAKKRAYANGTKTP